MKKTNINNRWAILKSTVTDAVSKALKENKFTVLRKEWITAEIISMIKERRKVKNGNTLEYKLKYRKLSNLTIQKSKELKEKYLEEKCKVIEVQMRTGSRDAAYKSFKNFLNDYKPKRGTTEDRNRTIIYEDKDRGTIW